METVKLNNGRVYELHKRLNRSETEAPLFKARCVHSQKYYAVRLIESSHELLAKIRALYENLERITCANVLPLVDSFMTRFPLQLNRALIEEREGVLGNHPHEGHASTAHATVSPLDCSLDFPTNAESIYRTGVCLVFPFCANGSVQTHFRQAQNLPQTVKVMREVTHCLRVVHSAGLIHGSLGPASVLLDFAHNAWVTGFEKQLYANARSNEETIRQLEHNAFDINESVEWESPEKSSASEEASPPEATHAKCYTEAMDIWHLGTLLIFLASGRTWLCQVDRNDRIKVLTQKQTPRLVGEAVSTEMKLLVLRCCNADPQKRPNAREVMCHYLFQKYRAFERPLFSMVHRRSTARTRSGSDTSNISRRRGAHRRSKSADPNALDESAVSEMEYTVFTQDKTAHLPENFPPDDDHRNSSRFKEARDVPTSFAQLIQMALDRKNERNFAENDPMAVFDKSALCGIAAEIDTMHPRFLDEFRDTIYRMLAARDYHR